MSDLPAPLTPSDCDLRGYEWMKLFGHRLFNSGWYLAALKDSRGGIAALKLWWVAMNQVPAGSLPNDEHELSLLADFGSDIRAWRKHRPVALRGFILCSDNRWHHPFLAELAADAFESRRKTQHQRDGSAARMRRHRARGNGAEPPPENSSDSDPVTRNETRTQRATLREGYAQPSRNNGESDASRSISRERGEKRREERGSAHALPSRARATPPENVAKLREKKGLPPDWQPSAEALAYALSLGFDADWMQNEANGMRNWAEMARVEHDDWDKRFLRRMDVSAYTIRQAKAQAEPKSVHQQIREAGNLPTFLGPMPDDDNQGIRLTAIAGGKS